MKHSVKCYAAWTVIWVFYASAAAIVIALLYWMISGVISQICFAPECWQTAGVIAIALLILAVVVGAASLILYGIVWLVQWAFRTAEKC
jgi:hypothetical protein